MSEVGPLALFAVGLLEFLGVPFPGAPLLVAAGALAGPGHLSLPHAWVSAVLGALVADQVWYWLARTRGDTLLVTACRVSANPKACACNAREMFDRFGAPTLLFAKLIPAMSNLATPVAGLSGVSPRSFVLYSAFGSGIWAAVWLGLGAIFERSLLPLLARLVTWGPRALLLLLGVGALLLLVKVAWGWWAVRQDPHPPGTHGQNPFGD